MEGPKISTPEKKIEVQELSVEHAARLLFFSFRFSQGSMTLQRDIFQWLSINFPFYRITEQNLSLVEEKVKKMVKDFMFKKTGNHPRENREGVNITDRLVDEQVVEWSLELGKFLNNDDKDFVPGSEKSVLLNLARGILDNDYGYLVEGLGRPSRKRHMSQFVFYVLEHKTTGVAEYDQMFKEISGLVEDEKQYEGENVVMAGFFDKLAEVKKVHRVKNHV